MTFSAPLAHLLRPSTLDEYCGQQHLLGENGPIRQLCERKQLCSMILWGPPGCGKTSLVNLFEQYWQLPVIALSAINSGIKDIKSLVNKPSDMFSSQQIVFVDEIHRFNKTQQDAFLPYVENGRIILIGATTENPAFSVNSALLSRLRVFTLESLEPADLHILLSKALHFTNTQQDKQVSVGSKEADLLVSLSHGDARRLLSNFEVVLSLLPQHNNKDVEITKDVILQASGSQVGSFDKQGDDYYDILSAFHKSIRGSSVDGSLYWYARLLIASTDIVPICRRLLAIASEDIGNADPNALQICLNAWDIYHRVGLSEGERAVAQAVIYCALAPKSNAVYEAFKKAKRLATQTSSQGVPLHLRNSTSQITKTLGHGEGYQYAHNYPHAFTPQQEYLPEALTQSNIYVPNLYQPSDRGLEKKLAQKIAFLQSLRDANQENN